MRTWLIAMAAGGTLAGFVHTAAAQEIKRTGGGFAKSECFISAGSCGGLGPATCSGPDCNTSVSGNGTNFVGVSGESRISMSAINISISGDAKFTPPSYCSDGQEGHPVYTADGNQSIYANVPNGTPVKITIAASLSGTGGGWATWSDAKSGADGVSGTTVFNAAAGPGKITVSGVDYYFIDSIHANGAAVSRRICSVNSQSFSGSVSMSFCVAAGKMSAASSTKFNVATNTSSKLKVRVKNGCTNAPLSGQSISFSAVDPAGGQDFSLPSSALTDADGFATVSFTPGSAPGIYSISAFCSACGADRQVAFTATGVVLPKPKSLGEKTQGSCNASIKPSPPPHEVCPGAGLPLICDTCNPTSAQRTDTWKTTAPATITQDMEVPEKAIFSSPQEGDFAVNLIYNPHLGVASGDCNASTTVKVRRVEIVKLVIAGIEENPVIVAGNTVSAQVGDKFYLYVHLNGPYADTTGFGFITVQNEGTIVKADRMEGSRLRYLVETPIVGAPSIVVTGCALTQKTIQLLVDFPIQAP